MKRSRQRLMKKIQRKTSPQRELVTGTRKWQYTFFARVMKSGKLESDMITGELDGYKGTGRPREITLESLDLGIVEYLYHFMQIKECGQTL